MSLTDAQIGTWVHRLTESGVPLTKPHICDSVVVGAAVTRCGKRLPDTDKGEMVGAGDIEGRCKTCSRNVIVHMVLSPMVFEDDGSTAPVDAPDVP